MKRDLYAAEDKNDLARSSKIISQILDYDEMNLEELRYKNKYIRQYSEGPINFVPSANRLLFWNE